jgi:hypothetical protein
MAGCEHSTALLRIEHKVLLPASLAPGASMPAQGTRVVLAVRPEKLIIEPPTAAPGRALPARIENVVYVGTAVHLHLRTERGARLLAYRQNSTALPAHIHPGANVQVSWQSDAARLVE